MMNCRRVESLVTDYLDGLVSGVTRLRYELHLRICPSCSRYVAKMQMLVEALGRLPDDQPVPREKLERYRKLAFEAGSQSDSEPTS